MEVDPFTLAQPIPWITSGEWTFSGWIKGPSVDPSEPTRVYLREGTAPPFFIQYGWLTHDDTTWAFVSQTLVIPPDVQPDSLWLVCFPSSVLDPEPHYAYIDGLSLVPNFSTDIDQVNSNRIAFRPNPATDKLWIDLAEVPTAITAIDASGRTHEVKNFAHRGHTAEVDVTHLRPGIHMLRISTTVRSYIVRFMKA